MLNTMRQRFPGRKPPIQDLYQALQEITAAIASHGIFNYLLSDGEHFFAHCSTKLCYIVRQAPFAAPTLSTKT